MDALVHSVRMALHCISSESAFSEADPALHPDGVLSADVENAFGEISRVPFFEVVRTELPELFELTRLLYGQETYLFFALDEPTSPCHLPGCCPDVFTVVLHGSNAKAAADHITPHF